MTAGAMLPKGLFGSGYRGGMIFDKRGSSFRTVSLAVCFSYRRNWHMPSLCGWRFCGDNRLTYYGFTGNKEGNDGFKE